MVLGHVILGMVLGMISAAISFFLENVKGWGSAFCDPANWTIPNCPGVGLRA